MNLKQLRYIVEVSRNGLSVSKAARALNTSQPGISQQIRVLEKSLGLDVFTRDKNKFTGVTIRGETIIDYAQSILFGLDCIGAVSQALVYKGVKELVITTTHTQARYVLPDIIDRFYTLHPKIRVNIHQSTPPQIVEAVTSGSADVGVSPVRGYTSADIHFLRCREYQRVIVVPIDHPLLELRPVTLADVVKFPIITYEKTVEIQRDIMETFAHEGLVPNIRLTASDADVIKTYVEKGLGISILPENAISRKNDPMLRAIHMDGVFPRMHTNLLLNRNRLPSLQCVDFVKLLLPRWDARTLHLSR